MERISEVVFNPSTSIRHVHCVSSDTDRHYHLKKEFSKLNKDKGTWLVATATCKHSDSVPLILQGLGESLDIKKESCKTVDDFMAAVNQVMDNLTREKVILGVFGAEDLASFNHSALSAFLSIPATFPRARICTVAEVPWGFTENVESAGTSQPVELFVDEFFIESEASMITSLTEELKIDRQIVGLVVQSISAHITDRRKIEKLCIQLSEWSVTAEAMSGREKINRMSEMVKTLMRRFERRVLLLPDDENESPVANAVRNLGINRQLLLLSAFCASHNSATGDKRFFVKHHGKEQRSDNRERAVELASENKDNGPKAVDAQRIGFIYQVFVQRYKDEIQRDFAPFKLPESIDFLPELYSLENMSLIARASSFANVDQPKFKCMMSFETAKKIAKNLDIILEDYLERRVM